MKTDGPVPGFTASLLKAKVENLVQIFTEIFVAQEKIY
jgi:hypothetical protein